MENSTSDPLDSRWTEAFRFHAGAKWWQPWNFGRENTWDPLKGKKPGHDVCFT